MKKHYATDDENSYNQTLTEKVFKILEENILNGKYTNGDSLVETKLSHDLGVSRTPIREALRQLELEGLVKIIPNKGAIVLALSPKDIEDIYTIRSLIEGLAARLAAENITAQELKELNDAIELEEFYTTKNDIEHLMSLDSRFHQIIFKASRSRHLQSVLSSLHHYVQKARTYALGIPGRAQRALEEHKAVLEAIRNRDAEKAEKKMTEHLQNARLNLLQILHQ